MRKSKSNKIRKYLVGIKYPGIIGDYLENNSKVYCFSPEKNEEKCVLFVDEKKRIFAIVDEDKNSVELAHYANIRIRDGIERILASGRRN